jgi:Acyl-protein synthetase, LuxE
LRLFAYQLRYNEPYAAYCASVGVTLASPPPSWEGIPAVPAPSFRDVRLATFPGDPAIVFETSGTTSGRPGRHYLETLALYDAAALAAFDRFMLAGNARLRYFNCVPDPREAPHSSLGYMMHRVSELRGDGETGWYLRDGHLCCDALIADLQRAIADGRPICLAATAFALVHLLDAMGAQETRIVLPPGSRVMETGGFKGRSRAVSRDELYAGLGDRFGITGDQIVAEYGMTELSSQYYDDATRRKMAPPWLRARVVGPQRTTLPSGRIGSLLHVDLANRSSCIAVQTEDLGKRDGDGLILIGREADSEPRGCGLDAEELTLR